MSKFDEEVNKILFEANFLDNVKSTARGVLGGVSDVLGGTLGLAKTGAAMLGSKLSYAEPIENFLKGDNKGETNKQKQPNKEQQKNLENVKMSKFLFEVNKIQKDIYKTKTENDFSSFKNKQILENFLKVNEKLSLIAFSKLINQNTLRVTNSFDKIISDAELIKFSNVDVKNMSGLQDMGANLKWLYSIHKNETYLAALTHLYNFLSSLPVV